MQHAIRTSPNYLVTGATGFLGRYIVRQLHERGETVRALVRKPEEFPDAVEVVRGDLTDRDSIFSATRNIETVFHTAALPGISMQWRPFYETNVVGTQNVIAACQANGVKRLVFTGSPSVTFDGKPQENVDESAPYPTRWLAHYPHSKAIAEQAVLNAEGLLTCSLRPHLIWGPGDRHLIPRLLDRARRGRLMRVGDGRNLIDMIYVENAAAAHLQAADALTDEKSPVNRNAYFLSQGEPVRCWDWIDEILKGFGLPPVKRSISFGTAWTVGVGFETVYRLFGRRGEPMMTRFLAAQLALHHYFCIDKAKRDFGYKPIISTEEGMNRLLGVFCSEK